ncbi:hypothetical protein COHA_005662 [Chlorella ohadii]|uniref:FAM192A/Fyv6 N-terminal domain-containing protein n=1 Tax=Chlorella ohadii TaxID=2649997 RepID=A0AAD5DPD0_9CHLO|nr:hypothetical protein COHA_005662 [Chlorella ohadii]
MASDRQAVPLVRVPREEQYFDREEVLGRDAASVFPTESKKAAAQGAGLAELLGANKKFISETELQEIKSTMGLRPEDGTIAADKPLAEVLREAKEAKEAAFQEQWKKMKQGKNRPLDEDELDFVDSQEGGAAARASKPVAAQPKKQPLVAVKPLVRPIVRVKSSGGEQSGAAAGSGGSTGGNGGSQPAAKRQKTEEQEGSGSEGEGLAGLLGGYGSGSDSE